MTNTKKPRIDRVTTRGGDQGETSLADGNRYLKSHPRIKLIGELDELNCAIGVAALHLDGTSLKQVRTIQSRVFDMGAAIATGVPQDFWVEETEHLSDWSKAINSHLQPLKEFVLPGGNDASAFIHVARAKCRSCERAFWELQDQTMVNASLGTYLNRLSDYLFVLSRAECPDEILWEPLSR